MRIIDYYPAPDTDRFLREDIHKPTGKDNPYNAISWKVNLKGAPNGILAGREYCVKETFAIAQVPMNYTIPEAFSFVRKSQVL